MDAGDVLICAPRRASRERVCHGVPISTETQFAGAAVHCNMLHHSPANLSDAPSSRLLCAFNARSNPVTAAPAHPAYRPHAIWDDACVKEMGRRQLAGGGQGSSVLSTTVQPLVTPRRSLASDHRQVISGSTRSLLAFPGK
jgi:hypothetical protein